MCVAKTLLTRMHLGAKHYPLVYSWEQASHYRNYRMGRAEICKLKISSAVLVPQLQSP